MPFLKPTIGRIVHYQAHGSPDGTHKSEPRAAIITKVHPTDTTAWDVDLCVLNPTGMYFNQHCHYGDATEEPAKSGNYTAKGGTWHWPPRQED